MLALAAAATMLFTTGCTTDGGSEEPTSEVVITSITDSPAVEAEAEAAPTTESAESSVEASTEASYETSVAPVKDDCAHPTLGLSETALGHFIPGAGIFTDAAHTEMIFFIEDIDNQFDPCAELSWALLGGGLGDIQGPAGTGSSIAQSIVFFHEDQMITDPAPGVLGDVMGIERVSDSEVLVTIGIPGATTAKGIVGTRDVPVSWTDGQLDLADLEVTPWGPTEYHLDFTSPLPGGPIWNPNVYGNVNTPAKPKEELDTSRYPDLGPFRARNWVCR